jgi:hypothetical protein
MIKQYEMRPYITLSHDNKLYGKLSSTVKKDEVVYKFLFDNSNDYICLKKKSDLWIFAGGMKSPNDSWINELGKQIEGYEESHLSRQA